MAHCLYECLQAVGLQHHHARFTSMGVCHAAHLSALTMEDYPLLGIRTVEDRTRLFHLVQMVKTDLKSFVCDDDDCKGYAVVERRFSYARDPDDENDSGADVSDINAACFDWPSSVRRRLDFSCETTDLHQKLHTSPRGTVHNSHNLNYGPVQDKMSTIQVQLGPENENAVLHGSKQGNDYRTNVQSCLSDHHAQGNVMYNSGTGLTLKSGSMHKQTPRSSTESSKRFNNKPVEPKDRKRISRLCMERGSHGASGHLAMPTAVYESKGTAGYNYGLPLSSPAAVIQKRATWQGGHQRISVCVRKRPLTYAEGRRGEADVVTTPGGDCVIIHESKEALDLTQYILEHRFYFDQVFGEESSNEEVYQRTAYPLVQHMLSGGKATCFAYGQTGAGKTHTMLGSSPRRPGLYALAVRDIFAELSATHAHSPLLVYVSFFEIYCGQLYDLLDHRKRLFAREDSQKVVHIAGLHEVRVDSVTSLLEVIFQGMGERTQGMSGVNPLSSRSHALLQIQLRGPNQQVAGRMWFVDLAGSERASDRQEPDRQSRMEGAEINQSLLALKECIRSLDQEQSHTPFRQSKLTQVLKDSFVGDSMTCMIANISPGHLATEHTLNTLRYADRVKELRRQGEVRGRRRGKTAPSLKHNPSRSSSSTLGTRGKSPPKKAKLGRQGETFSPTSRITSLPMGEEILCSTPKDGRRREETSPKGSKVIGFEHITPVRGWLGAADKRERVKTGGKQEVKEIENETTDSHSVRCLKGREGLVLGQPANSSVFSLRKTLKVGREKERKPIEQRREVDGSREMQNESVIKKPDGNDKEKEMHLRWYHQQLQQFIPSSTSPSVDLISSFHGSSRSPSNQASLSSPVSPTFCSHQQPSHLSLSALMCQRLEELLEAYRDPLRAVHNRGQLTFVSGENCLQPETSFSLNNKNNDDAHGDIGSVDKYWRLSPELTEARFVQDMGEHEKSRLVKATSTATEKRDDNRSAAIGGEGRWAWPMTTENEHADRMTGAAPNTVQAQVSYSCDSEDRQEGTRGGLTDSDVPADGLWSTKEGGEADSCIVVSIHSNNDSNGILTISPFESPHQQAPAETPFSPACDHTDTLPLPLQNTPQAAPLGSHREKEQGFVTKANRRFSNTQSSTQPLTTSIMQTEHQKTAKPLNNLYENPVNNQVHRHPEVKFKMPVLPCDALYADAYSCTVDPLSFSLLQLDQQVATALFLQEETNNTSECLQKNESGEDNRRNVEKNELTCSQMLGIVVENEEPLLELPQPKIQCPVTSDTVRAISYLERRKDMCCSTYEHCGIDRGKHHIPEVRSLQDQENTQKPQTRRAIEVLSNKAPTPPLNLSTCASIIPSVAYSSNSGSSISHSLIPSDAMQMPPQYGDNMCSKPASSISKQQSESVLVDLNTMRRQSHTVHSHHGRDLDSSFQLDNHTDLNDQESTSSQQVRHFIHLAALEDMNHAQWCVVRAHWEQLEEMEALCHKEGALLCKQPDMAFREYIHKLEKIMERKAQCVHNMRAQLQPYLSSSGSNQFHDKGEYNNDSVL